jgi:hypothetical protein
VTTLQGNPDVVDGTRTDPLRSQVVAYSAGTDVTVRPLAS